MDGLERLLIVIALSAVLVVACIGAALYWTVTHPGPDTWGDQCRARGDIVVSVYRGRLCVRPDGRIEMGQP